MSKEECKFLKKVVSRPALHVGENRLDLILAYIEGFFAYKAVIEKSRIDGWSWDYDMQRWLFIRESASIAHGATITGWSLMMRCYGNRQHACEQLCQFVEQASCGDVEQTNSPQSVANDIYQRYRHCRYPISDGPIDEAIAIKMGDTDKTYEGLVSFVQKMIPEPYSRLHIYLQYERYFLQVRFLYHSPTNGWVDGVDLAGQEHYYDDLIVLHALAALAQNENHPNHIITIRCTDQGVLLGSKEIEDCFHKIFNQSANKELCNKSPMESLYLEWKTHILGC